MLTAHQHLALLRRFPEAKIEIDEEFFGVFVMFPNGDGVWGFAGAPSRPGAVLPVSGAGYHSTSGPISEEAWAAEQMLREFLGCD